MQLMKSEHPYISWVVDVVALLAAMRDWASVYAHDCDVGAGVKLGGTPTCSKTLAPNLISFARITRNEQTNMPQPTLLPHVVGGVVSREGGIMYHVTSASNGAISDHHNSLGANGCYNRSTQAMVIVHYIVHGCAIRPNGDQGGVQAVANGRGLNADVRSEPINRVRLPYYVTALWILRKWIERPAHGNRL